MKEHRSVIPHIFCLCGYKDMNESMPFVSKKGKMNSGGVFGPALSSLVLKLGT